MVTKGDYLVGEGQTRDLGLVYAHCGRYMERLANREWL